MRRFFWMISDFLACRDVGAFHAWKESEDAQVQWYLTYRFKARWLYSGVARSSQTGVNSDIGYVRDDKRRNRRGALKELRRLHPTAHVLHVDDVNKIITFMVSI